MINNSISYHIEPKSIEYLFFVLGKGFDVKDFNEEDRKIYYNYIFRVSNLEEIIKNLFQIVSFSKSSPDIAIFCENKIIIDIPQDKNHSIQIVNECFLPLNLQVTFEINELNETIIMKFPEFLERKDNKEIYKIKEVKLKYSTRQC